ncbi:disease resistance protein Pik-1-like [Setaria viridis]|uniref:disease resistance protein Pik-1-like n=1 Tax=Setaria viridis TaxID=4556 RepID=UPI001493D633|nr:disease resistance protein Pik-1-like [Setaria viridis]
MEAFLVCKAKEDNFIAYDWAGNSSHAKQIRRLSLSTDRCPDEDVLSHTRSLVVSGYQCQLDGVPFKAFKKLRVLQIHGSSSPENGHLVDICRLIWLKCLDLMGCDDITELPREIGRLQNLETLYVAGTRISKIPTEIGKLQHLETLDVSRTMVTELPTWIEKLQSLKTLYVSRTEVTELPREIKNLERLETLDISWTWVIELPKEIGKLQHLRTLDISGTKVRELSYSKDTNPLLSVVVGAHIHRFSVEVEKLMSPLGVISSSGREEVIISSSEAKCRDDLSILILFKHFGERCEVLPVWILRVAGRHMKVPKWVKQDLCNVCTLDIRLWKLVHEDLEFLKTQMPNLQALQLRFEVLPREPIAITGGWFPKLETFYVDCRLPRVITFKRGAMPKMKHLEFKFYTGIASQDYYMGIKHLDSLEKVVFRCSEYYTSDGPGIRETIDDLRKEAVEHPNKITLWVNDMLAFGTGAKWISLADKAIVEKRDKLFRAARVKIILLNDGSHISWQQRSELSFSWTSTAEEGEFAPDCGHVAGSCGTGESELHRL